MAQPFAAIAVGAALGVLAGAAGVYLALMYAGDSVEGF